MFVPPTFSERDIKAIGPEGPLRGTLVVPKSLKTDTVIIIIPGSGPTDRNGNSITGFPSKLKLLAEGLANRGISSARIDKRGMFGSSMAVRNGNDVTIAEYATDISAWMVSILEETGSSSIWILGHSEGGLVAQVVAQNNPNISGIILVAAAGRQLGEVLREQLKGELPNPEILDNAYTAIKSLESGKPVNPENLDPGLMSLFGPHIQKYLIDVLSYDPAKLISNYEKPALIIQGKMDVQIKEQDALRLSSANKNARLILFEDMNHVLKSVRSTEIADQETAYKDPEIPLTDGLVEALAEFVLTCDAEKIL